MTHDVRELRADTRDEQPIPRGMDRCRVCGHLCSVQAKTCPGCGQPEPTTPAWSVTLDKVIVGVFTIAWRLFLIGIVIAIAAFVLSTCGLMAAVRP